MIVPVSPDPAHLPGPVFLTVVLADPVVFPGSEVWPDRSASADPEFWAEPTALAEPVVWAVRTASAGSGVFPEVLLP